MLSLTEAATYHVDFARCGNAYGSTAHFIGICIHKEKSNSTTLAVENARNTLLLEPILRTIASHKSPDSALGNFVSWPPSAEEKKENDFPYVA